MELIDKQASSEVVAKAIKTLQSQNQATKRKFSDIDVGPSSISATDNTNTEDSNFAAESPTSSYERGMIFVENCKNARIQRGFKRMDWSDCYSKGFTLNLFQYKSADVLRNQFNKYLKQKSK